MTADQIEPPPGSGPPAAGRAGTGAAPREAGPHGGGTRPEGPTRITSLGRRARTAGRGFAVAGRRVARLAAAGGRGSWRGFRRVADARGAGESGLGRVIDLHLVASTADALIVTALASTIFFAVPTQEARGRVATSLLVTMVPFTLLAPVIGPLLDRVRRGRRYALATTLVVRAFLAWVMAGAVGGSTTAFSLYPAAFGFLVCQKAYIVTRAAALPRVLPPGTGLVAANSRISLAGVAALAIGGPLGAGVTRWFGPSWTLRMAFAVFAAATALALALPARIDSDEGELPARISGGRSSGTLAAGGGGDPLIAALARGDHGPTGTTAPASASSPEAGAAPPAPARAPRRRGWSIGPAVVLGLRSNAALRAFTGFLTLFLAFRLRTEPLRGFSQSSSLVLVVALAAIGGGVGNGLGSLLRRVTPERVVVLVLAVTAAVAAWSAIRYGPWAVGAVALAAGTGQSLGKLCLDLLIQREVPERVRTSAFARSETVLQLAWVLGGGVGLALPLSGAWGLGVAAVGTGLVTGFGVASLRRMPRATT